MSSQINSLSQDIACFSCSGSEDAGYLKCGYFQKLLNSELTVTRYSVFKLFGKVQTNFSIISNTKPLFMEIKRNFSIVKGFALNNADFSRKASYFDNVEILRTDILKAFYILLANLQQLNSIHYNSSVILNSTGIENNYFKNTVSQLIKEIKNLLIYVGRISSINSVNSIRDFQINIEKSTLNFHHYYHLCLDVWYNCLAVLYEAQLLMPLSFDEVFCDFIDQSSPFLQLASYLVYDLSYLAVSHYRSDHTCNNSAFLCPCIKEFWIMLINLIEKFNSRFETSSFWNIYLSSVQVILKNVSSQSSADDLLIDSFSASPLYSHIQSPVEACLWLTSHVAPLYKYNVLGYFCEYEKARSGYVVLKYLVHNLFSASGTKERSLRNALLYCIQLAKLWEPSGDMLLPLTDFYMKKIDRTFNIQEINLSYLFNDALAWFTYVNNLSALVSSGKESSYDLYLCILNLQLRHDADNNLWRSLKGRIYSKFIPKKIKDMSEVAVQNCFSLFHIIVMSGQFEIVDKLCEIASIIETVRNPKKQMISWKALFVLLFIYQEKRSNAEKIASCISKFFNTACSEYARSNKDSVSRIHLMNLLLVYIDNMNELFKINCSPNLSAYQLISSGFSDLLAACGPTEVNYILSVFLSIVQRIQAVAESRKADYIANETESIRIIELIFNNIYPFMENVAATECAPLVLSDIAAVLTKLMFDFSSVINCTTFDFHKIFMYFACKEVVGGSVTCQYLCCVLDYPSLVDEIRLRLPDLDTLIFQSWLKCVIYTQTKSDTMQELSQKVVRLPLISQLFPDSRNLAFQNEDHVSLSIKFFNLVGNAFSKCHPQQKMKMAQKVQQCFKNYVSLVLNKIKEKDGPTFSHVYNLTSHLVEHCSPVLHFHVTSEHLLLQILDQTVYPQLLFPRDKSLQYLASCSIKEYLPNFIRGLFKLDYRQEKSVEREIRDIFIYYIGMFPMSGNPLIKLVVDSVSRMPEGLTPDAYSFILEALKCNLLSNNVEKPISIFEFYQEIFKQVPPACKKEISNILLKSSMEIYMKKNDSLTEYLNVLIKKVLICFKDKMMLSHSKVILIPIIQWFIQEKLQWSVVRGFSVLDIFVEYVPQVMSDIVPFLTKSVEILENNRGLGEDMLLRNGLRNFISKLQRKLIEP